MCSMTIIKDGKEWGCIAYIEKIERENAALKAEVIALSESANMPSEPVCPRCDGDGFVWRRNSPDLGSIDCPVCKGTGKPAHVG